MAQPRNEIAEVLGSQEYAAAFRTVMSGGEIALLPDDQRNALMRAKELTHSPGPGYPMPLQLDPTRADEELPAVELDSAPHLEKGAF